MGRQYRFDDVQIDLEGFRLSKAGCALSVEPKALNLLIFLVENCGRLVERRELLSAVWGDAFVTDHVLNRAIGQLRKVLEDDPKTPQFIETVPTLGYRFIAVVEAQPSDVAVVTSPVGSQLGSAISDLPDRLGLRPHNPETESPALIALAAVLAPRVEPDPVIPTAVARPTLRVRLLILGFAAVVAFLFVAAILKKPSIPEPLESTQITFSANFKDRPLFTDGARLYFEGPGGPSEMAVNGGMIAPLRTLEPSMHLLDISANGSKVLAWKADLNNENGGGSLWVSSTLAGTPHRIGHSHVEAAVWSGDGNSIIFIFGNTLYTMDESGASVAKLWDSPGTVLDAISVSPDGKQLCVTVETSQFSQIWIMHQDGTEPHRLSVEWPADADLRDGHWTPDGKHFIFRSDREGHQNIYEVVQPDWLHFWQKPRAVRLTGNQIEIRTVASSQDSQGLYLLGRPYQGAMQVFHPESKTFSPFLNGFSAVSFVISPDRQWMAYTEYPSETLWKSRLDGSEALQLTKSPAYWEQWSPDSESIVYSDWHKLYRVSAQGGPAKKLIASGDYEIAPTWKPDGKSIYFNYFDPARQPKGILVVDLATGKVSPLPGGEPYYGASWSPDGHYLVALAQNPLRMMIYSAETKTWRVLKTFDIPEGLWIWSHDSKSIYMAILEDQKGMYRLGVPDGTWEQVVGLENIDSTDIEGFPSLTSDGQPVIMSHTGISQLYFLRWRP